MSKPAPMFVAGERVESSSGNTYANINPATEEDIGPVHVADAKDVDRAVESSKAAQAEWWSLDASQRGAILYEVAHAIEQAGPELAALDCLDGGRPILDCREDVHAAVNMFRYFAGLADKITGQTLPVQSGKWCLTKRVPYGVIAAVTAWNYPLFNACAKIAPILATGNSCILKPAEETPLTAVRVAELMHGIESLPSGLVNVLQGPGETTGEALSRHSQVGKISVTGSIETGRSVLRASADSNLKGTTLELGGKSPVIVFSDANIETAVKAITFSMFYNQGQTCTAGTRLLVHKDVSKAVLDGLKERLSKIVIGSPDSEATSVGPLISAAQLSRVESFVEGAVALGIKPVVGGRKPKHLKKGFYFEPTIFCDVPESADIWKHEIFGPVLVVREFRDEAEAIALANNSTYGLACAVWTSDVSRMLRVADGMEAGIVWGNTAFAEHPGAPAGGFKESGIGREYGQGAIEEYTQQKAIWLDFSGNFLSWP